MTVSLKQGFPFSEKLAVLLIEESLLEVCVATEGLEFGISVVGAVNDEICKGYGKP